MRSIILLGTSVLGLGIPAYQQLQSVDRVKLPGTPSAEATPSSEVAPVAQPESSTEKLQAEQGLPTAPQAADGPRSSRGCSSGASRVSYASSVWCSNRLRLL